MNYITKHVIKHGVLPGVDSNEINEWAKAIVEEFTTQKNVKVQIIDKYLKLFMNYVELLDKHLPEWRFFAEKEIEDLKSQLR